MMFTREDRQTLQTMIDNKTITTEHQPTPLNALKAIQTTIKDEEHYWHHRHKILSNIRQLEEQVHALNNRITTLANNYSFQDPQTTETIKIMPLQHTIRFHEARDQIRLQGPATLTSNSLLNHCKLLEQQFKHYRKAYQKGRAELTSLPSASATNNSVQQNSISTQQNHRNCYRCGYRYQRGDYPAIGQRCHRCNGTNHFSTVCRNRGHRNYRKDYDDDR